jgi:putative oxidoreductase
MQSSGEVVAAIGRILLSVIFLVAGIQKLLSFTGTAGYFGALGIPFPTLATVFVILFELIGGAMVLLGLQAFRAGLALAVWCVLTAAIGHSQLGDPDQLTHFLKNVAMAGGFLLLAAHGSGAWALDKGRIGGAGQHA